MPRSVLILAALLATAAAAEAQSLQKLPLPRSGEENLQFGNAAIAITMPSSEGAPILITASASGTKSVTLNLENDSAARRFPPEISMAEMDASNTTPEFFISRFSGGAHCCAQVWILDVVAGQWRIVDGGSWDGAEIIPEDADGDGEDEIVHGDDVSRVRHRHDGRAELAADGNHVMLAGDGDGNHIGRAGVQVEPLQVHKLQVVFVREHSDGIHVAHAEMHRHLASPD